MSLISATPPINPQFSQTQFKIDNFLTSLQQNAYQSIGSDLKKLIKDYLLDSDCSDDLEIAKLILHIVIIDPSKGSNEHIAFFRALITSQRDDILVTVNKLLSIVKSGLGQVLFQCAKTQKIEYYSFQTLADMINVFETLIPHLPNPCPILDLFPPYDQGGKELLAQITKKPAEMAKQLVKMQSAPITNLTVQPVKWTLQDLFLQQGDFNQLKSNSIQYLSSLEDNRRLQMSDYLAFFKIFQKDPRFKCLTPIEKSGLLLLILISTTEENKPITIKPTIDDLCELMNEAVEIHNECGDEILIQFCLAPDLLNRTTFPELLKVLKHLKFIYLQGALLDKVDALLKVFSAGKKKIGELAQDLELLSPMEKSPEIHDEVDLETLAKRFNGTIPDPNVLFPLSKERVQKINDQYLIVKKYCSQWAQLNINELAYQANIISMRVKNSTANSEDIAKLVAIGRLGMRITLKDCPFITQVWAVLAALDHENGCIGQIQTGEGKTYIAVLKCFVLSMIHDGQGHIISSDHILAKRDQAKCEKFFKPFGISTSHICDSFPDASRFQARILYGTATDFEFALMREMMDGSILFPDWARTKNDLFPWVEVDEVDNLSIDTTMNGARLGAPSEATFDWVYAPILKFIKENSDPNGMVEFTNKKIEALREYLKKYMDGKFASQVIALTDIRLKGWMIAAYEALFRKREKIDYLVGWSESSKGAKVRSIQIVDFENTGRIMHGSRWCGGVHEFVEAKHGLEIERESIVPISMSHPVLYQNYARKFGVTGTNGGQVERDETEQIYGIPSFDVPTHRSPKRVDLPTSLCETDSNHLEAIYQKIDSCIKQKRPVLVLCETIEETERLGKLLEERKVGFELLNENQKKKEEEILEKAGLPGAVTIATNTAGRGTDIKPSEESLRQGGLHVILANYPASERVEKQARGRAGRQGQPGSSEMILSIQKLIENDKNFIGKDNTQRLEMLQQKRMARAIMQRETHISFANLERFNFKFVKMFYQRLNRFQRNLEHESSLDRLAKFLNARRVNNTVRKDYSKLGAKKRLIAKEAEKLLTNLTSDCTTHWKVLLRQVAKKVKDETINFFANDFLSQATTIIHTSCSSPSLSSEQLVVLAMISSNGNVKKFIIELNRLLKESKNEIIKVQKEIEQLFLDSQSQWNYLLDLSGSGVIAYLNEITQYDLTPLETDSQFSDLYKALKDKRKVSWNLGSDFDSDSLHQTQKDRLPGSFGRDKEGFEFDWKEDEESIQATGAKGIQGFQGNSWIGNPPFDASTYNFESESKSAYEVPDVDVEVPQFVPGTLPRPPKEGIKIGLRNFGNTCWLNSTIQFIACTSFYDEMLIQPVADDHKRLQALLRYVVFNLRSGKEVPDNFLRAFLKEIKKLFPSININGQNDAPEFLAQLTRLLSWKPVVGTPQEMAKMNAAGDFPQLGISFLPKEKLPAGWGKFPRINDCQSQLEVTIQDQAIKTLDLASLIEDRGDRDVYLEKINPAANDDPKQITYLTGTTTHLLQLPVSIMVYVKRFFSNSIGSNRQKIKAPIQLDKDGCLTLQRYQAIFEQESKGRATQLVPKESRKYRVGAAIVHIGDKIESGHYICLQRAENGQLFQFSDEDLSPLDDPQTFGNMGLFLRLDLVVDKRKLN